MSMTNGLFKLEDLNLKNLPTKKNGEPINFNVTIPILGEVIWRICQAKAHDDSVQLTLFCYTFRTLLADYFAGETEVWEAIQKTKTIPQGTSKEDEDIAKKLIEWSHACCDAVIDHEDNSTIWTGDPIIFSAMFQELIDYSPDALVAIAYKCGTLHPLWA